MPEFTDSWQRVGSRPNGCDLYASVHVNDNGSRWHHLTGAVETPTGFVFVSSSLYTGVDGPTGMDTEMKVVCGDRVYRRSWDTSYSPRYLVTLAARFARQVAAGEVVW